MVAAIGPASVRPTQEGTRRSLFYLRHLRSPSLPYLQASAWGMRGRGARVRTGVTNTGDTVLCAMSATARGLAREHWRRKSLGFDRRSFPCSQLLAPELLQSSVVSYVTFFQHIVSSLQVHSGAWEFDARWSGRPGAHDLAVGRLRTPQRAHGKAFCLCRAVPRYKSKTNVCAPMLGRGDCLRVSTEALLCRQVILTQSVLSRIVTSLYSIFRTQCIARIWPHWVLFVRCWRFGGTWRLPAWIRFGPFLLREHEMIMGPRGNGLPLGLRS